MTLLSDHHLLSPATAQRLGRISLVGAGPGAADLLTLRALRRLAEADVVCYDRLVDPEVLAMARAGAELLFVGKEVGAHSWPQDRINAYIIAAALRGLCVVRLKSGDPSVFGRAAEEIAAARDNGIPVEIVPGITAASAAAATLCRPLTERGEIRQLVIATATARSEEESPLPATLLAGSTYALYMAVHRIEAVATELARAGLAAETAITVVSKASSTEETVLECSLADLVDEVRNKDIKNPAVVLFCCPLPPACRHQKVSLTMDMLSNSLVPI